MTTDPKIFASFETALMEAKQIVEKNLYFCHEWENGPGPIERLNGGMPLFRIGVEIEPETRTVLTGLFGKRYQAVQEESRSACVYQATRTGLTKVATLGRTGYYDWSYID